MRPILVSVAEMYHNLCLFWLHCLCNSLNTLFSAQRVYVAHGVAGVKRRLKSNVIEAHFTAHTVS